MHGPTPSFAARQHDRRAGLAQQALELQRDVERVRGLAVAVVRLGPGRVALLALTVSDRHLLVDLAGVGAVLAVVAGVDRDDDARETAAARCGERAGAAGGGIEGTRRGNEQRNDEDAQ